MVSPWQTGNKEQNTSLRYLPYMWIWMFILVVLFVLPYVHYSALGEGIVFCGNVQVEIKVVTSYLGQNCLRFDSFVMRETIWERG